MECKFFLLRATTILPQILICKWNGLTLILESCSKLWLLEVYACLYCLQTWLAWPQKVPNLMLVSLMPKWMICKFLPSNGWIYCSFSVTCSDLEVFSFSFNNHDYDCNYVCIHQLASADLGPMGKNSSPHMMRFTTALTPWAYKKTSWGAFMHMVFSSVSFIDNSFLWSDLFSLLIEWGAFCGDSFITDWSYLDHLVGAFLAFLEVNFFKTTKTRSKGIA